MSEIRNKTALPELLCPAGSHEALEAAIEGGADAVYLGGTAFHARMHAQNFTRETLGEGIRTAHRYGVSVYLTLNTLVYDRELRPFLHAAYEAAELGADGLIVADLGGAAAIHREMPTLPLHASTQMCGHNATFGQLLRELGYSRIVLARELSLSDIREAVRDNPLEVEIFVHGALCVSQSGQCLFSSLVGGRSGNRGECAQPCRLPYTGICGGEKCAKRATAYPLSLKDLSLARSLPALIDAGVASLKIEGRMKSAAYVLGVTRIFRRLLDERRGATDAEMQALGALFSRSGFTDGYFREKIGDGMLGVRSESDKDASRTQQTFGGITRKIPLTLAATVAADTPIALTVSGKAGSATVSGCVPQEALTAPLSADDVRRSLSRLGATAYAADRIDVALQPGLMVPVSALNALRRAGIDAYEALSPQPVCARTETEPQVPAGRRDERKTAVFYAPGQITQTAADTFDLLFLPLFTAADAPMPSSLARQAQKAGAVLPPVIPDSVRERVAEALRRAKGRGYTHLLVGNIGHLSLARESGMHLHGDYRFNVTNTESVARLEQLGIADTVASPEMTLPQLRDLRGNTAAIVYGRIPLMTLEKCVIRTVADCAACGRGGVALRDRKGVVFPLLREWEHRNLLLNSLPTNMSDRTQPLLRAGVTAWHFLFTTESPAEVDCVLEAFHTGTPLPGAVRRIGG